MYIVLPKGKSFEQTNGEQREEFKRGSVSAFMELLDGRQKKLSKALKGPCCHMQILFVLLLQRKKYLKPLGIFQSYLCRIYNFFLFAEKNACL